MINIFYCFKLFILNKLVQMNKIILKEGDLERMITKILFEDGTFTNTFDSNQQPTQQPVNQPSDVKTYSNVQTKATAANKAASRINTTTEFSGAFKNWFSSLGYKPENNTVTISRVQMLVKQAMTELGYK